MAAAGNTREKIIQASLELFNSHGERSITTNHIAAHLEMSPGNLYYHFKNKQAIVAELFARYQALVEGFLQPPQARALTVEDKAQYLEALLSSMWQYRFLHRDLEHLLASDEALGVRYRAFASACLVNAQAIYQGFVRAGILAMNAAQIEALAVNSWILLSAWVRFLSTAGQQDLHLSHEALRRGMYQVLALEEGYATDAARGQIHALQERLYLPLSQLI